MLVEEGITAGSHEGKLVTKASAKRMLIWSNESGPCSAIGGMLEADLRQDVYGVRFSANLTLHFLNGLETITRAVLKKPSKLFTRDVDRRVRLELGLLSGLYRGLSQWQAQPEQELYEHFAGSAQSVQVEPWMETRALALGGTFTQALTGLHVLANLMKHVAEEEMRSNHQPGPSSALTPHPPRLQLEAASEQQYGNYQPSDYFDHISGTGVSGISAIMLSVLKLDVSETIERMKHVLKAAILISQQSKAHGDVPATAEDTLRAILGSHLRDVPGGIRCGPDANKVPKRRATSMKGGDHWSRTMCVLAMEPKGLRHATHLMRFYERPTTGENSAETRQPDRTNPDKWPIVDVCFALVAPQLRLHGTRMKIGGIMHDLRDARQKDVNAAWTTYQEISEPSEDGSASFEFLCSVDDGSPVPGDRLVEVAQGRYHMKLECLLARSFHLFKPPSPAVSDLQDLDSFLTQIETEASEYCVQKVASLKRVARILVKARCRRAQAPAGASVWDITQTQRYTSKYLLSGYLDY